MATSAAATNPRAAPFTVVKSPPKYTVLLDTANARTVVCADGLKLATSAPVVAENAAIRDRTTPLASVNDPPA